MTNKEILQKGLNKATKNGWYFGERKVIKAEAIEGAYYVEVWLSKDYAGDLDIPKHGLVFRHDFAKAFWGEEEAKIEHQGWVQEYTGRPAWQYHLQQMVLEEDPLKYLEKFL